MENAALPPLSPLRAALRRCRAAFGYAAAFSLSINLLTVVISLYSMQVLDRVFSSRSLETLGMLTFLMLGAVAFLGLFAALRSLLLDRTGAWLDRRLSPQLLERAVRLAAQGQGAQAGQQQRDLGNIRQFITGYGLSTLFDAPWTVVYLLVTFAISVPLGLLTFAGCALLMGLGILTELATKTPLALAQRAQIETQGMADAIARQAETVEAMGMLPALLARWHTPLSNQEAKQDAASIRASLLQAFARMLRMALQIAVTGIGAYLALEGHLTSGGMIAATILSARAFAPFENAIGLWKQMVSAREAMVRLEQATHRVLPARGEMTLPAPKGDLYVERLGYQPVIGARPVLQQVSFLLPAGESLGIIGPSGAGKSTLARLLTGIVTPGMGTARLDGNDLSTWNRADLGAHLGYLPQNADLFVGTIRDNIARMQEEAPAEAVLEAAELAGVHTLIQQLPMGYDTRVGPSTPLLSPGQRQRVALARAVYGNPKLVILDEPNLHLDGEGEEALIAMLRQLKLRRVTTLVVAHKPNLIACLDHVLVLNGGMVERFGPREQVVQSYLRSQKQASPR